MAGKYQISGRVIDEETSHPVAGAVVEAWDKDHVYDDLVGSVTTDSDGRFQLEFDDDHF